MSIATEGALAPETVARVDARRLPTSLRRGVYLLAAFACLTPWATPPLALTAGMVLALLIDNPYPAIAKRFSKFLLQASVVMLGFGMNMWVVLHVGERGALFAAATIFTTLTLGYLVGRLLNLNRKTGALISAGTAICGGSAIAAVSTVLESDEGEITVAMGTVFLLNAAALYLFPPIGHALGLTQQQFGTWAGVAIHDISSVVGAAKTYGLISLQIATAVKLSRALWIVPVVLGMAWFFRATHHVSAEPTTRKKKLQIPWFIGLFLLASVLRSFCKPIADMSGVLTHIATIGFTLTLFLIGAGLSRKTLKAVGWKALALGITLWFFISVVSLLVIRHVAA